MIEKKDLPKNCHECPFTYDNGKVIFCTRLFRNDVAEHHSSVEDEINRRRVNCPLEYGQVLWM